ncbi:hypothetical protein PQR12_23515 [Paraburkholderia nemoris]|uniref:hypothetical protein n=1 Tax=Paraburkholderia nemoris TaxID=2793076 RepID=UPI0038BDC115
MLKFYDAPQGSNIKPNVGKNATHSGLEDNYVSLGNDALALIKSAWAPWFSAPQNTIPNTPLNIRLVDIAAAIFDDTNNGLPLNECFILADLFLLEQNTNNDIALKPFYEKLPKHYKRANNEILATAASIAAAKAQGYNFIGEKSVVEALYGKTIWTKPWSTSGPDYLLYRKDQFCFLEAKGHAGEYSRRPVNFEEYKVQSVNANLVFPIFLPPTQNPAQALPINIRHVLSYGNLPYDVHLGQTAPASIQWFNAENSSQMVFPVDAWLLKIALAVCQFYFQLTKTDSPPPSISYFIDIFSYSSIFSHLINQATWQGPFIILVEPIEGREHVCAIHEASLGFFYRASRLFRGLRAGMTISEREIYSTFSEIESLSTYITDTITVGAETYYTEFVSPTGIFSLNRNPQKSLRERDARRRG